MAKEEDAKVRRIYRSKHARMLGGVCGGMAEYFNVDPVLFRLLFVLLTLMGFAGIVLYLVAWLIIPEGEN